MTLVRSPRSKKTKGQLRDYLQTGRKRKAPTRSDLYILPPPPRVGSGGAGVLYHHDGSGYSTTPSGMSAELAVGGGTDLKWESLYAAYGSNLAASTFDPTGLYQTSYQASHVIQTFTNIINDINHTMRI